MSDVNAVDTQIRTILKDHARLVYDAFSLAHDNDLYLAGMTSLSSVSVMLALEDGFNIEFPDHMLNKKVFGSIGAIRDAILQLQMQAA
jgi:acyl carrier protein